MRRSQSEEKWLPGTLLITKGEIKIPKEGEKTKTLSFKIRSNTRYKEGTEWYGSPSLWVRCELEFNQHDSFKKSIPPGSEFELIAPPVRGERPQPPVELTPSEIKKMYGDQSTLTFQVRSAKVDVDFGLRQIHCTTLSQDHEYNDTPPSFNHPYGWKPIEPEHMACLFDVKLKSRTVASAPAVCGTVLPDSPKTRVFPNHKLKQLFTDRELPGRGRCRCTKTCRKLGREWTYTRDEWVNNCEAATDFCDPGTCG